MNTAARARTPAQRARPRSLPAVRPYSPVLPHQPDLSHGTCSHHPRPGWWTSGDRAEREAAMHVCRSCPALTACREWSLNLPGSDTAIYGGLTASERIRARRERAAAAAVA